MTFHCKNLNMEANAYHIEIYLSNHNLNII